MTPNGKINTGDPVLDAASEEYRRTGKIDVFNNMMTFAYDSATWREIGAPKEIVDGLYAVSPFAAVVRRIGQELSNNSHS